MADEAPQVRYAALHTPAGCAMSCACAALRPLCGAQQPAERWTLWVKRTDVKGAQYDDSEGVDPQQLVSTFKKRWLSDKKLGIDPSLVTLRLVKRGPGVPTASEEAASTLLVDPSATLRGAGVADGSWLLADFAEVQATAGACLCSPAACRSCTATSARVASPHSANVCDGVLSQAHAVRPALPCTVVSVKPSFVELLAQGGIARPSKDIIRLIELHFAQQAIAVSDAEGAVHLYDFVKTLPGTRTQAAFAADLGITVGGPLFPQHSTSVMGLLLSGTHEGGKSVIVKVLYAANATIDVTPLEAHVCDALELAPWDAPAHPHFLVRATAVCMSVKEAEARIFSRHGHCWAVVMPRYSATLGELAQLSLGAVTAGCARLCGALDFMHSRGFVHCDVKSANVLITHDGCWLLSDFGSCARAGEPLTSTTEMFHVSVRFGCRDDAGCPVVVPATPALDWQLLFCLLLVEAFKSDWKERLMPPGWGRVSERAMRGAYDELLLRADATEETRQLARQLNARAYNF